MQRLSILVLGAVVAVLVGSTQGRSADDKVAESLDKAKTKYDAEMKKAQAAVGEYFDKDLKKAQDKGDKKRVDRIKDEQKAFDHHGILTTTAPQPLQTTVKAQRAAIESAYTTAVKAYTKAKKDDLAAAVEKDWNKFQTDGMLSIAPGRDLWIPMFNGTDLTGWEILDKPVVPPWKVVDGAIQGENKEKNGEAVWLRTINKQFDNYHVRMDVLCSKNCLSYFHFRDSAAAGANYNITLRSGRSVTGSLAKHSKRLNIINQVMKNVDGPHLPENEWFTVEIIARGYSISIFVNGQKKIEAVDADQFSDRGSFCLELQELGSLLRVRKIDILSLPPLSPVKK